MGERNKWRVPFIAYKKQYRNLKREIDRVISRVLSKGDLILRSDVEKFEKNLASFLGVKHAVGLSSGTDALYLSLKAAGIGPEDEVVTVSHTFVASIASIAHVGAKPVLVDVRDDFLMDADKIEGAITKKTKAIMPVHLNGRVCDMDKVMKIARKRKLIVIEDAAQSLGAEFRGKKAGSFGLTGCFSFYPAKLLGAYGDAGAVATDSKQIAEKIRLLRDHGQKTPEGEPAAPYGAGPEGEPAAPYPGSRAKLTTRHSGAGKTEIVLYGWTARLDNLQAAVLNVKFKYLPNWIKRRREIARLYDKGLSGVSGIKVPPAPDANPRHFDIYQNYVLRAQKRNELFGFLKEKGVETLIKDPVPNHWQKGVPLSRFHLPVTERLAKEVISLPMYPELTKGQIQYVIKCVRDFYE